MPNARYIHQAAEKIAAICAVLRSKGLLQSADMKSLAKGADVSYSTLKTAVQSCRFSHSLEEAVATFAKFDRHDCSWVDDALTEVSRRNAAVGTYPGRDTADRFRERLLAAWGGGNASFRSSPRGYAAIDPHMARHQLSDLGQSTSNDAAMQLFLTAHFEPFYHSSGIMFGFRKVSVTAEISEGKAFAGRRIGHPAPVRLRDATIVGDGLRKSIHWTIEHSGTSPSMLKGEYTTTDEPLLIVMEQEDGTAILSQVEVNLFDRTTCSTDAGPELGANKQALIEQIFSNELASAANRRGWIVLSRHEAVIARYEG